MTLLFRILRAAHASGTHHKLALDALLRLKAPDSERWRRLFLEHAALYMQGSKAPDTEFKDFKNHVLHVRDGYWGGAPDKVVNWYANLIEALKGRRWSEAVWAAGVLSHYYTDPIHPFHTGQTEAENDIHRAVEWSINRSYDQLMPLASVEAAAPVPGQGADWLRAFVMDGAEASNRQYEKLIAHYDIDKGVTDPPAGLDPIGRKVIADLLRYAATGFAAILDRAFEDAAVNPPDVNLTLDTVIATLQIPVKQLAKRLADAEDRRIVELMYDELKTTGRVDRTLPEDDRIVRDLFAKEVLAPRAAEQAAQRAKALTAAASAAPAQSARRSTQPAPLPPAPAATTATMPQSAPAKAEPPAAVPGKTRIEPVVRPLASGGSLASLLRIFLTPDDDVERAPSIGPKTAERLYEIGIRTVADLLAADPAAVADEIRVRHITADAVSGWQDQARLVMGIPGLRGTHAQLLVGAGFRDVKALSAAEPADLSAAILAFAATTEGQRVLRDGHPPHVEKIANWISLAQSQAA
ncbi:MAG: DUF4332 domain-containing protein [Hyphomicrobiaceae bacterium]